VVLSERPQVRTENTSKFGAHIANSIQSSALHHPQCSGYPVVDAHAGTLRLAIVIGICCAAPIYPQKISHVGAGTPIFTGRVILVLKGIENYHLCF